MSKKATAKTAAVKPAPEADKNILAALITVRVVCAALGENGETHHKGDTFETTPERARALGDSVEVV